MIYILVLLYTLFLFVHFNVNGYKRGELFHYYFLLVIVCCIAGFSYRLGMDTIGYMEYFERIDDFKYTTKHLTEYRYEPAFVLLLASCKTIWNDFTLVQIVVAVFVNTVIFWFARRHAKYYFLVIFFYFIFGFWNINFEIKRESIAICFFLLGVDKILKEEKISLKNYFSYYIFCLFSALFHHFGFITFLFPLATKIRLNRLYIITVIVLFMMSYLGSIIFKDILTTLNTLMALYSNEGISDYLDSGKYGVGGVFTVNGLITGVIVPFYIVWCVRNKINKKILSLTLFYFLISALSANVFIFYRVLNYLFMFLLILYSQFAEKCCISYNKNVAANRLVLLFAIGVLIYGKCHKLQYIRYSPYSSVFTKEINAEREAEYDRLTTLRMYD